MRISSVASGWRQHAASTAWTWPRRPPVRSPRWPTPPRRTSSSRWTRPPQRRPCGETLAADIPLVVDPFRYFAAAARAEEGRSTEIEKDMVAYHFREPLGVVGQIIPFNFPLLMAAWKLAPALAAGNCSVIKPASPTPWSILKLAEVIEDVLPQ